MLLEHDFDFLGNLKPLVMFTKVSVSIIMDIITPECNMVITSISDLESGKSQA